VGKVFCFENEAGYNKETILMQQRITALTKLEIYAIGLAGFALLFGAVSFVDAAACQDW